MSFLEQLPRPFFILAPMDDVTDTSFRRIIADCAPPDVFFTEFVNVDGLQSPGRPRLLHKLNLTDEEHPIIAQLWGLKPENFYKTTKELIEMGYDGVDLNMGCPVRTVTKNGACAALINNRPLAGEIIDAVKEAAGDTLPVSVKTRVGFTTVDMDWIEFLLGKKILNMLSIHGRTAKQMSKVPADWDLIGQAAGLRDSLSPGTLIVGNGDVADRAEGERLADKYDLDGIMIGRGIFHNPFAFSENSPWEHWNKEQKLELFSRHISLYLDTYKEKERRFEALRKFCKVYINGFDGAAELRAEFMSTNSPQEALELIAGSTR
ncbi:MAG TPA: tRNA-dihydrouridine synthase [Candidatus Saccharimonadales bacterium]|nr:tRNA-dihydrouridine synthase [Candidatus Saccharimonadales bacterium]